MKVFYFILAVIAVLAIDFLITAGAIWVICWAFGLSWSWKFAIGVWLVMALISAAVKARVEK